VAKELNERQVEMILGALLDRGFVTVEYDGRGMRRYKITPKGNDYMRGLLLKRAEADEAKEPKRRK